MSSVDAPQESCWKRVPWLPIMRVLGGALGVLIIVLGIIGIITNSFSPRTFVDNCYQVLFGLLIILSELRFERALKFFTFLCSYTGLGLFYVFVGGLALGGEWYNYVLAICFLTIGVVYTGMGCCYGKQMYVPKDNVGPPLPSHSNQRPIEERPLAPATSFGASHSAAVASGGAAVASSRQPVMAHDPTPDSAWPDDDDRV